MSAKHTGAVFFVAAVVALLPVVGVRAAPEQIDPEVVVQNYEPRFNKLLGEIVTDYDRRFNNLNLQYASDLNTLLSRVAGNEDRKAVVQQEINRFSASQTVRREHINRAVWELGSLQTQYVGTASGWEKDKADKIDGLTTWFQESLNNVESQLRSDRRASDANVLRRLSRKIDTNTHVAESRRLTAELRRPGSVTGAEEDEDPGRLGAKEYPEGTFMKFGHRYYLLEEKMTWDEANRNCKERGGHMLSLDSKREFDFIFNSYVLEQELTVWVDSTDFEKEGVWLTWENKKAKRLPWAEGEPTNQSGENFAELGPVPPGLRDVQASRRNYVICEWEK